MSESSRPTIFALHGLGLGGRLFDALDEVLGGDFELVRIGVPGFGGVPTTAGTTVDEMVAAAIEQIADHGAVRWLLLGHSMGGKLATIVAARALSGTAPVFGLAGVVLLAGSPPSPEPMADDRREQMISWARRDGLAPEDARAFVDANVGSPLSPTADDLIMADLQRCSGSAWTAWLERGSREDRAAEVGTLDLPALIISGGDDDDLGAAAQRELNGPVYPRAVHLELPGAGHLLPVERPTEVGEAVIDFWRSRAGTGPGVPADAASLIASNRTGARTRAALAARAVADDPDDESRILDRQQLATLRVLAAIVVPQTGRAIDLARRVDVRLASSTGDGWRHAGLPPDVEAYRLGLDSLCVLRAQSPEERLATVEQVAAGASRAAPAGWDAEQLSRWFEDVCVDLVQAWVSHPATMAQIGFDGYGNGGDGLRQQGFQLVAADEREPWEPASRRRRTR